MKKKFGFFCLHFDPPIGGAERSMKRYFENLSSELEIHVFCFLNENGTKFMSSNTRVENGIKITQSAEPLEKTVLQYINSNRPDFIGTQLLWSDPVVALAEKNKIPCYYFAHGLFEDICQLHLTDKCSYNSLTNCAFGDTCPNSMGLKRFSLKYNSCKKIFCNSVFTRSIFNRFFSNLSRDHKLDLLYPYVDVDNLLYKEREKKKTTNILAVNSNFAKGRDILISIAQELKNVNFTLVDTKDIDRQKLSSCTNITLLGKLNQKEMIEQYHKSDAVLIPTFLDETFSLVACESILCGTPVIASRKGNLPNLVIQGKTGFIVDTYDLWDWLDAIEKIEYLKIDKDIVEEFRKTYNPKNGLNILRTEFRLEEAPLIKEENIEIEDISSLKDDNKKTILFLAKFFHPPLGGGEYFLHKLLKSLKEDGFNIISGCYSDPSNESYFKQTQTINWDGIPVFRLKNGPESIEDFVDYVKPDIVITQSFDALRIIDAAKRVGAKTILGTHFWRNICDVDTHFVNMLTREIGSVRLLTKNHRAFFESDQVYVNSEFMKLALKKYTGFECENIIHPIIDLERVISKNNTKEFITLVNPDEGKGGALFVQLAERLKGIKFLCVGKGNEFHTPNRIINRELNRLKNVTIVESSKDMSSIYGKTKILLIPSRVDETFSMVALEALFNGIPVLASTYGNLPYLIEDGGFNLPLDDVAIWEKAIDQLNHDTEFYNELSLRGKEVAKKYIPEKEIFKFKILVDNCLRSG